MMVHAMTGFYNPPAQLAGEVMRRGDGGADKRGSGVYAVNGEESLEGKTINIGIEEI